MTGFGRVCMFSGVMIVMVAADTTKADEGSATAKAGGKVTNAGGAFGRHRLAGAPVGNYTVSSVAEDSLDPPRDVDTRVFMYRLNGSDGTRLVQRNGPSFHPDGQAFLDYGWDPAAGNWFWDSSFSFAHVHPQRNPPNPPPVETAMTRTVVRDPATMTMLFDDPDPRLLFNLDFAPGTLIQVDPTAGMTASASISGYTFVDLLGEPLWTYSWSTLGNGSVFSFSSNSALGLNDGAIEAAFMASVIQVGGASILPSGFSLSAALAVATDAQGAVTFTAGGEVVYTADAMVVPGPGSALVLGSLSVVVLRRRRGR